MPQSLSNVIIHAVFSTKHREPILASSWRKEIFDVLGGSINKLDCRTIIVGGVEDHVHLLFSLSRTITIATLIGKVKMTSSRWINQNKSLPNPFHWQTGYGAFSISHSKLFAVREYIWNQEAHHAKQDFQNELCVWFREYEMEWDDRFVWD